MTEAEDPLRRGRQALGVAAWDDARTWFERSLQTGGGTDALAGFGEALQWLGDYDGAIEAKSRAFAAYLDAGQHERAAEVARGLAFLHGGVHGNFAAANGWFAQAASALEPMPESAQHGWLAFDRAPLVDDPAEREQLALSALAIARRFGDHDLEFDAIALLGEARVQSGRVAEGMTLIDQAMAAVSAGQVRGLVAIGDIYCRLLSACERATDVRRAEQWMGVVDRFVQWSDSLLVSATCRLHYGGLLVATGRWTAAEAELMTAIRVAERSYRVIRTYPLVRLADLRLREGRLEEAERLLEGAEWHPLARRCQATMALYARDTTLARELASLCLSGVAMDDLSSAPVFDLIIDIELACGDIAAAETAADQLAGLAAGGDHLARAWCAFGTGRLLHARGEQRGRLELQAAIERFSELLLPLEAARARLALAGALVSSAPEAAASEAALALDACNRLGARRDADAAAALLRRLGRHGGARPRTPGVLTAREAEVLTLLGEGLSNAQIADRLTISRRTAEHHVARILAKLGVRSRAEAAVRALQAHDQDP